MPPPVEKVEVYVPKPEAPKPKPNPNGVYLPTGDERNGKPVFMRIRKDFHYGLMDPTGE